MVLSVAVEKQVQRGFALSARFESAGRVTALFGRSGAGKTTLVNLIAGLVTPDAGRIAMDDVVLYDRSANINLPANRRRIGYVFQEGRLFPHMSVRSNLLYGRHLTPVDRQWGSLDHVVGLLGIGHLLTRRPAALSGGEKQRVAIGRALLASPRLLLMDEPLAALDQQRKEEIIPYIERLRDEMHLPIVYVSHAVEEVARIADTLVVLGEGRVVAAGPVSEILARADLRPYTGQAEASAVLTARVTAQDRSAGITTLDHAAGRLTVGHVSAPLGTVLRFRVRARDVALAVGYPGLISMRNRLAGTVTAIHHLDPPGVEVHLDVGGEQLVAAITRDATYALELAIGQPVTALIKSTALDRFSFSPEPPPGLVHTA